MPEVPPMPVFKDGRKPLCESKGCPNEAVSFVLDDGTLWLACEPHGGTPEITRPRLARQDRDGYEMGA